jgi:hypothetical protein
MTGSRVVRLLSVALAGALYWPGEPAAAAGPYLSSEAPVPMARRSMVMGRLFDPATSGTENTTPRVPKPAIISKAQWGGKESSGTMTSHVPTVLTLHHEGSPKPLTPDRDPKVLLQNLQKWGWSAKGWADIPYHFMVDLEGRIYECRDIMKSGDTATTYDPTGHLLVTAMGNYELQAPTEKQLSAICDLMAWACDVYNIDPATLRGHLEYAETACPGKYLYPFGASGFIEGEVRARIARAYGAAPGEP